MAQMLVESTAVSRDRVEDRSGNPLERMNGYPIQYSALEKFQGQRNSKDHNGGRPIVHEVAKESDNWAINTYLFGSMPIIKSTFLKVFLQEVFDKKYLLVPCLHEFCRSYYVSGFQFDGHSSYCNFWTYRKEPLLKIHSPKSHGKEARPGKPAFWVCPPNYIF